jgi:hypothetical protein
MLVFNCTKTAAEFFTVTRQGKKQSPLEKPPTPAIIDTQHENLPVSSWLVHAIKVQRKNVLIAMHVHTRYAMVFTGLQKGNYAEFSRQWLERPLSVRIVVTPSEKTPEGDGVTNETYFTGA